MLGTQSPFSCYFDNLMEYSVFLGNQVTPFNIASGDESLYAWHVLPLRSVLKHEERLQAQPTGFSDDITTTESFRILKEDPNSQLVISCELQYLSIHVCCIPLMTQANRTLLSPWCMLIAQY